MIVIDSSEGYLFIDNVAVRPERQGQGLGPRLMQFAEDEARRLNLYELRLYTNEKIPENLAIYARMDFEIIDHRLEGGYRRVYVRKQLEP